MRAFTISLFLLFGLISYGQNSIIEKQLKEKTDSILVEGNLLFRFEKAAWISTDLAMEKINIKKDYNGYLVYQIKDTIKVIILNMSNSCIYELSFLNDLNIPYYENLTKRNLTESEEKLLNIKNKIINELIAKNYSVECPTGFSLNKVLIPFDKGYKLYILTGTSQSQIIPFGNDYLFLTDEKGVILTWKKFHSRLLSVPTISPNGDPIKRTTHSHLRTEPFISATDICTFKLYGSIYGQKEFLVYSPTLLKWFKYKLIENEIEIADNP